MKTIFYLILELIENIFGQFFIIKTLPIKMKSVARHIKLFEDADSRFAIVMQGPMVKKNNFTIETLAHYRSIFPNALIVLSTWESECDESLDRAKNIGVDLVISRAPDQRGDSNVNLQLKSTIAGIERVSDRAEYILKTRTDQRIYSLENWLEYLKVLCDESQPGPGLDKKLIVCNLNMYRARRYVVSDMFMFGKIKDINTFWNMPFQAGSQDRDKSVKRFRFCGAETYLMNHFLTRVDWRVLNEDVDSKRFLTTYFNVIDKDSIEIFWYKYNHFYDRKFKLIDGGRSSLVSIVDNSESGRV